MIYYRKKGDFLKFLRTIFNVSAAVFFVNMAKEIIALKNSQIEISKHDIYGVIFILILALISLVGLFITTKIINKQKDNMEVNS